MRVPTIVRSWLLAAAVLFAVAHGERASAQDADTAARTAIFEEIWRTVRDRFYDPAMRGRDWSAIGATYRPLYLEAPTSAARTTTINAMLGELGVSHMGYFTPEQPEYYQLADIFLGRQRRDNLRRVFPDGEISYPGIGIFTMTDGDGRLFVKGVIDGAPAHRAGLLTGDEILAADGQPFAPIGSFRSRIGLPVQMTIRRHAGGSPVDIAVVPEMLRPTPMFLRSVEASARLIPAPAGLKIGYVRVWSYASPAYQEALQKLITDGALKDADALVWDLRDGWGGAQVEYLELFDRAAPDLRTAGRNGQFVTRTGRWRKPVAMLINEGTRSGKEILAYGFKKYGYGEVIGTTTARDVLAATAYLMADNTLVEVAVNDVLVDGERLEHVGVAPTIEVPFDRRYAAGRDPQLDTAIAVLSRRRMN